MEMRENKELSKEQLEEVLHNLTEQGNKLYKENNNLRKIIEEVSMGNLFKRLDYLFKVVNDDNKYISESFKEYCAKEIESIMMITEEKEEQTEK